MKSLGYMTRNTDMLIFILFICFINIYPTAQTAITKEACYEETYSARCDDPHQVVLMDSARFGRMHAGRCITGDYGNMGCYSDVLGVLDRRCSGKSECSVVVNSGTFNVAVPCSSELFRFLQAAHTCDTVLNLEPHRCQVMIGNEDGTPSKSPPDNLRGTLLSSTVVSSNCGRDFEPLMLEALPGQTFVVTLVDFYWTNNTLPVVTSGGTECSIKYGQILDIESERTVSLCGGLRRVTEVLVSEGHRLQIKVDTFSSAKFMLKYQVRNCPSSLNIVNGWFESRGNIGQAGCHDNDRVWDLTCRDNVWQGLTGDCIARRGAFVNIGGHDITTDHLIIGVSLIVLSISAIIMIAGCCYIRTICCCKKKKPLPSQQPNYYTQDFRFLGTSCAPGGSRGDSSSIEARQARGAATAAAKPNEQETSFSRSRADMRYRSLHQGGGMQNRPLPEIPEYDVPRNLRIGTEEQETLLLLGRTNDSEEMGPRQAAYGLQAVQADIHNPSREELKRMKSMIRGSPHHMTLFNSPSNSRMHKNPRLQASTMGRVLREHPSMRYGQGSAQSMNAGNEFSFEMQPMRSNVRPADMQQQQHPQHPANANNPHAQHQNNGLTPLRAGQNAVPGDHTPVYEPPDVTAHTPEMLSQTLNTRRTVPSPETLPPYPSQVPSDPQEPHTRCPYPDGASPDVHFDDYAPTQRLTSQPPRDVTVKQTVIPTEELPEYNELPSPTTANMLKNGSAGTPQGDHTALLMKQQQQYNNDNNPGGVPRSQFPGIPTGLTRSLVQSWGRGQDRPLSM